MKRLFLALLLSIASLLPAAPISKATLEAVLCIADAEGVPRSVAKQQLIEESGDWRTGKLGDPLAISYEEVNGYHSEGLFQLYMEPGNISWLLLMFWDRPVVEFDQFDALDNATVAMRYMAYLHDRFGNWLIGTARYNCGPNRPTIPESSLVYARRIVNAH